MKMKGTVVGAGGDDDDGNDDSVDSDSSGYGSGVSMDGCNADAHGVATGASLVMVLAMVFV